MDNLFILDRRLTRAAKRLDIFISETRGAIASKLPLSSYSRKVIRDMMVDYNNEPQLEDKLQELTTLYIKYKGK